MQGTCLLRAGGGRRRSSAAVQYNIVTWCKSRTRGNNPDSCSTIQSLHKDRLYREKLLLFCYFLHAETSAPCSRPRPQAWINPAYFGGLSSRDRRWSSKWSFKRTMWNTGETQHLRCAAKGGEIYPGVKGSAACVTESRWALQGPLPCPAARLPGGQPITITGGHNW